MADNKFDLNAALIFNRVIQAGSFTGGAKVLKLPTSTVSDRISELEKSLGITLLIRTTRKLQLTEAGSEFYRKSKAAIEALLLAREEITSQQKVPQGVIKISAPVDIPVLEIAEAVAEYKREYPNVQVHMQFSNRRVDLIAEGFDIAIRGGFLADSSLKAKRIGSGNMILVASPSYMDKAPSLKDPKDLANHRCIVYAGGSDDGKEISWELKTQDGKKARVKPPINIVSTSFAFILECVRLGNGIAFVPQMIAKELLAKKKVVHVLPEWKTADVPVHFVYSPQRFPLAKVKAMIEILDRKMRPMYMA